MNRVGAILLILNALAVAQDRPRSVQSATRSFSVIDLPAVRALVELSREMNLPLGIVEDDRRLCTVKVNYSATDAPASRIVEALVSQVPGYRAEIEPGSPVIIVAPKSPRAVTDQFLHLVDKQYGPIKGSPQILVTALWVHVRYLLHPEQGTAGSVLGSEDDMVIELEARNKTIRELLDHIAVLSRGTWILRPLPDKTQEIESDMPFMILPARGSSASIGEDDLCHPVQGNVPEKP